MNIAMNMNWIAYLKHNKLLNKGWWKIKELPLELFFIAIVSNIVFHVFQIPPIPRAEQETRQALYF